MDWGDNPVPKLVELGAIEKINDYYYAMIASDDGMVTFIADEPQGPFLASNKNFD